MNLKENFTKAVLDDAPEKNIESVITYLCRTGIISEKEMKKYLIYSEFPALQRKFSDGNASVFLAWKYDYHKKYVMQIIREVHRKLKLS